MIKPPRVGQVQLTKLKPRPEEQSRSVRGELEQPTLGMSQTKPKPFQPTKLKKFTAVPRQPSRHAISKQLRFEVLKRDGFRCRLCGAVASQNTQLQLDHKIPVSRGGTNDPANLQTLCQACNLGKSNRLI